MKRALKISAFTLLIYIVFYLLNLLFLFLLTDVDILSNPFLLLFLSFPIYTFAFLPIIFITIGGVSGIEGEKPFVSFIPVFFNFVLSLFFNPLFYITDFNFLNPRFYNISNWTDPSAFFFLLIMVVYFAISTIFFIFTYTLEKRIIDKNKPLNSEWLNDIPTINNKQDAPEETK